MITSSIYSAYNDDSQDESPHTFLLSVSCSSVFVIELEHLPWSVSPRYLSIRYFSVCCSLGVITPPCILYSTLAAFNIFSVHNTPPPTVTSPNAINRRHPVPLHHWPGPHPIPCVTLFSLHQAADCGIGIVGKEGKQASLAADFSIMQFCHLARLVADPTLDRTGLTNSSHSANSFHNLTMLRLSGMTCDTVELMSI